MAEGFFSKHVLKGTIVTLTGKLEITNERLSRAVALSSMLMADIRETQETLDAVKSSLIHEEGKVVAAAKQITCDKEQQTDAEVQEQAAGEQEQAAEEQEQVAGEEKKAAGEQEQVAGEQEQAAGEQEQAAGGKEQAAGEQEQAAGGKEQSAEEQKPTESAVEEQKQEVLSSTPLSSSFLGKRGILGSFLYETSNSFITASKRVCTGIYGAVAEAFTEENVSGDGDESDD